MGDLDKRWESSNLYPTGKTLWLAQDTNHLGKDDVSDRNSLHKHV